MPLEFAGSAIPLTAGDVDREASALGCHPAAVHAVCDIEAGGAGFLPDGRPKILFEAHQFHILTGGQWDAKWPNISSSNWNRALYGAGGEHQYSRLQFAIALDREAALKSASWGMFQIMGVNYAACGFASVEAMVAAMVSGEPAQLDAFVAFCEHEGIHKFLQDNPPKFRAFAARYNGPGQVELYADRLSHAYWKWLSPTQPNVYSVVNHTSHPVEIKPAPYLPRPEQVTADQLNRQELQHIQ